MEIKNLKDLEQLVKLCRKQGISSIEADGVKLTLQPVTSSKPTRKRRKLVEEQVTSDGTMDIPDDIETDELTPEQMLFYSVTNPPEGAQGEQ